MTAEVVPRHLNYAVQETLPQRTAWYVDAAGGLDVDGLIAAFQTFFREHSEHWVQRFAQYHEAGSCWRLSHADPIRTLADRIYVTMLAHGPGNGLCSSSRCRSIDYQVQDMSGADPHGLKHLSPGVWVLIAADAKNPLFTAGEDASAGVEMLAEVGNNDVLAAAAAESDVIGSGVFGGTPHLASGSRSFTLLAPRSGGKLYFAAMVAGSNDWFLAPASGGITLFDDAGNLNTGPFELVVWEVRDRGLICTAQPYKDKVEFTFAKVASLDDPAGLFNASLNGNTSRSSAPRQP